MSGAKRTSVNLSGKTAAKYDPKSWEFSVHVHTRQAIMRYAHYLVMRAQVPPVLSRGEVTRTDDPP